MDSRTLFCTVSFRNDPLHAVWLYGDLPLRERKKAIPSAQYRRREASTPEPPTLPRLGLSLDHVLKDYSRGWIFGSEPTSCDVFLDQPQKSMGVSGTHFRLVIDGNHMIPQAFTIVNLSSQGTIVSDNKLSGPDARKVIPGDTITISAGAIILELAFPKRQTYDDHYLKAWIGFQERSKQAASRISENSFRHLSVRPTTETPVVRHDSAWVESVDRWKTKCRYEIGQGVGWGAFGTVRQLGRKEDGTIFVVKIVRTNPRGKRERDILTNLRHDNIIHLEDWAENSTQTLLALEAATFRDLDTCERGSEAYKLREGPRVKAVMTQLLRALGTLVTMVV